MLITFEGIEGCGKSTQAVMLKETLEGEGRRVVTTREPGGTGLGEKVRDILLRSGDTRISPLSELLLYAACRAQIIEEVIRPALAAGSIVICDRFADSTIAYQGYGRELGLDTVVAINRQVLAEVTPFLTLLLDCEPEMGLDRAWQRIKEVGGAQEDRFEREAVEFHRSVREGYLEIARREPERVQVIDGDRSVDEIHQEIVDIVGKRLEE
ncbi:MAG: dTMP kinase [Deltaproteobacteria bacterium]|nr:dTMP kinase [Deltaproteobacteria bacterium]